MECLTILLVDFAPSEEEEERASLLAAAERALVPYAAMTISGQQLVVLAGQSRLSLRQVWLIKVQWALAVALSVPHHYFLSGLVL